MSCRVHPGQHKPCAREVWNSPPSLANVFPCSRKTVTFPDSAETYNSFQAGIKGENVRVFADRMCRQYLHGGQVNDGELVVSSPATKANLSATSSAIPCGLSIPVIA